MVCRCGCGCYNVRCMLFLWKCCLCHDWQSAKNKGFLYWHDFTLCKMHRHCSSKSPQTSYTSIAYEQKCTQKTRQIKNKKYNTTKSKQFTNEGGKTDRGTENVPTIKADWNWPFKDHSRVFPQEKKVLNANNTFQDCSSCCDFGMGDSLMVFNVSALLDCILQMRCLIVPHTQGKVFAKNFRS